MNFRPINDNVLLEPEPFAEQSTAGIWLPQPKREQGLPRTAKVIAVGPGKMLADGSRVPPQITPGDRVVYLNFKGQADIRGPGKYSRDKYLILSADDVEAVLE